jgi:hypothetical protein
VVADRKFSGGVAGRLPIAGELVDDLDLAHDVVVQGIEVFRGYPVLLVHAGTDATHGVALQEAPRTRKRVTNPR